MEQPTQNKPAGERLSRQHERLDFPFQSRSLVAYGSLEGAKLTIYPKQVSVTFSAEASEDVEALERAELEVFRVRTAESQIDLYCADTLAASEVWSVGTPSQDLGPTGEASGLYTVRVGLARPVVTPGSEVEARIAQAFHDGDEIVMDFVVRWGSSQEQSCALIEEKHAVFLQLGLTSAKCK